MNNRFYKIGLPVALLACVAFGLYLALFRPGYVNRVDFLAAVIFLQVLVAVLWKFEQRFFPFLMLIFLWAGSVLPLSGVWTSARWVVLGAGAVSGCILYLKNRHHSLGAFHLVAGFCVFAGLVSAMASSDPTVALLKTSSLFLLFLYGASGARLAVMGREAKFFSGLLFGCELLVYACALSYFVLRFQCFGNPNSLGAIMGVFGVPMMLWGMLISDKVQIRRRRMFTLLLAVVLLLSSYARAGIVGAAVAFVLVCAGLRQYRLLIKGFAFALLCAVAVVTLVPLETAEPGSVVSAFLYKGKGEAGVLESRRSVWDQTFASIQEHPWFGTGFGTSATDYDQNQVDSGGRFQSAASSTREHGNSYLAISEWVGLLGVLPFFTLVLLTARNVARGAAWIRRTGDVTSPVVPLTGILAAGLIHAGFEDWLFAVGYYLCVFFWISAFLIIDLLPATAPAPEVLSVAGGPTPWSDRFGVIHPGR
ncbi:MAG: O-antigen ligase family protein [Acidobacteriia bacterium]|nr:O-antigen ligase family protein [Terriglobia bacterium]